MSKKLSELTLKEFVTKLENWVEPYAKENTEASYEHALNFVKYASGTFIIVPLTDNQVRTIVNRAWNRYHKEKECLI